MNERRFARNANVSAVNQFPRGATSQEINLLFFIQAGGDQLAGGGHIAAQEQGRGGNQGGHLRRMLINVEPIPDAAQIPIVVVGVSRRGDVIPILQGRVGGAQQVAFGDVGVWSRIAIFGDAERLAHHASEGQVRQRSAAVVDHGFIAHKPILLVPGLPRKNRVLPIRVGVHAIQFGHQVGRAASDDGADNQGFDVQFVFQIAVYPLPIVVFGFPKKANPLALSLGHALRKTGVREYRQGVIFQTVVRA